MPEYVRADQAKGKWIKVKLGEEDPAYAYVSTLTESGAGRFKYVKLNLSEHPTCGHTTQEYPAGVEFEVRPEIPKGRKR